MWIHWKGFATYAVVGFSWTYVTTRTLPHRSGELPHAVHQVLTDEVRLEEEPDEDHHRSTRETDPSSRQCPGTDIVEGVRNVESEERSVAQVEAHEEDAEEVVAEDHVHSEQHGEQVLQRQVVAPLLRELDGRLAENAQHLPRTRLGLLRDDVFLRFLPHESPRSVPPCW